jgi:hypothetical protein
MAVECAFNVWNAVVSLGGVLAGGIIGFYSARTIAYRNAHAVAVAKLRAAFSPALSMIYVARHHGTHDKPPVDESIKNWLLDHGAAVEEFRPFVPDSKRIAYQAAWEKYRQKAAQCPFVTTGEEWDWAASEGEIIESNINAILSYTET